ncbi:hypothetical protein CNR22_02255 [Sphingobacteriaceae bacterium]|nr:hypothetical protein CNR22_02255 [Sphingobacteriaceae bacterium]
MKIKISIILTLFAICFKSQNLVPNPSFDYVTTCPTDQAQVSYAPPWFIPSNGTSDLYHSCSALSSWVNVPGPNQIGYSSSYAHSGSGMAGLFHSNNMKIESLPNLMYREYIAVRLNSTLISNTKYYVSFFVKLADSCIYAGRLGMFISKDSISKSSSYDTIAAFPQISSDTTSYLFSKTKWKKITGSFISNGAEKFIYIGNFKPSIANDTLFVGPGGRAPNGNTGGHRLNMAYYYVDDVCVSSVQDYCTVWTSIKYQSKKTFKIFPNPTNDKIKITFERHSLNSVEIIDIHGLKVNESFSVEQEEIVLDCDFLPKGVYFLKILSDSEVTYERFVKY